MFPSKRLFPLSHWNKKTLTVRQAELALAAEYERQAKLLRREEAKPWSAAELKAQFEQMRTVETALMIRDVISKVVDVDPETN